MGTVNIRELSRHTGQVVEEVANTGRPMLITSHGRPAVAIVPVSEEDLEDFVLANAPEFVRGMEMADRELASGETIAFTDLFGSPFGPEGAVPLTRQEIRVLSYLARQATNQEIAQALSVDPTQVKSLVAMIIEKLGLPSRKALVEEVSGAEP
jgi:prevent-host-death family protein